MSPSEFLLADVSPSVSGLGMNNTPTPSDNPRPQTAPMTMPVDGQRHRVDNP